MVALRRSLLVLSTLISISMGCGTDAADADGSGGRPGSGGTTTVGGSGGVPSAGGSLGAGAAGGTPAGGSSSGGAATGGTSGSGGSAGFTLTSANLAESAAFAAKYTCAAAGFNGSLSPALSWTAGPEGTVSYAITLIDVTLTEAAEPNDNGYHWVIYNIPATTLSLPEEFTDAASIGASQNGPYLGPCPNYAGGSATHTYEFTIYALASPTLTLTPTTGVAAVKDAKARLDATHLEVAAPLSGTSNAAPP